MAAFAEAESPDLIVMGTHGHTALGHVVLGSVASGVLARCKAPLLLVR
ncbi:universal stress protein [Piscinibacter sp. XHJ-5]|nr:universal stress protein [Piscinibacter sp. XHJ-5]